MLEKTPEIPDISLFLNKNPKVVAQFSPRKSEKVKRNSINPTTGKKYKHATLTA